MIFQNMIHIMVGDTLMRKLDMYHFLRNSNTDFYSHIFCCIVNYFLRMNKVHFGFDIYL